MILNSMKINNFRQYMGFNQIDFTTSNDKNFTIIKGTNGSGKTTILNAITWCIYGAELHNDTDDPIYNEIVENEIEKGGKFEVEVELEILNDDNESITFHRVQQFYKNDKGKIFESVFDGNDFQVIVESDRDNKIIENPDLFIDQYMPIDIEEYFFFDGEKLEDYFKENTGKVIKKSVFKITQLKLFKRLIDHLDERRRHFKDKITAISPKTGEIEQEILNIEDIITRNKELLKDITKQRDIAAKSIKNIDKELRKIDSPNIKKLPQEREKLTSEMKELDRKIDDSIKDKTDYLLEKTPIILANSVLIETQKIAENLTDKGFIPAKYKKNFLKDLMEEGKCICGTDLKTNETCKEHIKKLYEQTTYLTDISEEISTEYVRITDLLSEIEEFREKQTEKGKNIKFFEKEREKKSKRITEIGVILKDSQIENVNKLENLLEENINIQKAKIHEEERLKLQIESSKKKLIKLRAKRDKEMLKNNEMEELRHVIKFSQDALEAARKMKLNLVEEIREQIEEETKEQFIKLMWKGSFIDVNINNDYEVSITRRSGRITNANGLSAGEKLALALSFMAALNKISGFNLPIIIDTPMGRLDREIKLNIAEFLPKYLEDKQITLLVTGEEYSSEFREMLVNRVGKEYLINLSQTKHGNKSKVVSL